MKKRRNKNLIRRRQKLGLSQPDMVTFGAAQSVKQLQRWEQWERPVPLKWRKPIALVLQMKTSWVVRNTLDHKLEPYLLKEN